MNERKKLLRKFITKKFGRSVWRLFKNYKGRNIEGKVAEEMLMRDLVIQRIKHDKTFLWRIDEIVEVTGLSRGTVFLAIHRKIIK